MAGYADDFLNENATTTATDPRAAAAQELARKQKIRQFGVQSGFNAADASMQSADVLAGKAQTALQGMDQATAQGKLAMRRNAAQSLQAGQAAGGQTGGGGAYAATLQAGQTAGNNEAQYGAQQAQARSAMDMGNQEKVGQAKVDAFGQAVEASKLAKESGSNYTEQQQKISDLDSKVAQIGVQYNHWYGNDYGRAAAAVRALIAQEEDPVIKAKYEGVAQRLDQGHWDIAK